MKSGCWQAAPRGDRHVSIFAREIFRHGLVAPPPARIPLRSVSGFTKATPYRRSKINSPFKGRTPRLCFVVIARKLVSTEQARRASYLRLRATHFLLRARECRHRPSYFPLRSSAPFYSAFRRRFFEWFAPPEADLPCGALFFHAGEDKAQKAPGNSRRKLLMYLKKHLWTVLYQQPRCCSGAVVAAPT